MNQNNAPNYQNRAPYSQQNKQFAHQYHTHQSQNNEHHEEPRVQPEQVIHVVKQSRRAIFGNYVVIAALFYASYYGFTHPSKIFSIEQFSWFFLIVGTLTLIYSESKIHYKKLIITNKRAILNEGILKKDHITIRYASVTEVISTQTFFQRILNYGNIIIRTSGLRQGQDLHINFISNPSKIKRIFEHFMIGEHKV